METENSSARDLEDRINPAALRVGAAVFALPVIARLWAASGYTWWELAVWVLLSAALGGVFDALRTPSEADYKSRSPNEPRDIDGPKAGGK